PQSLAEAELGSARASSAASPADALSGEDHGGVAQRNDRKPQPVGRAFSRAAARLAGHLGRNALSDAGRDFRPEGSAGAVPGTGDPLPREGLGRRRYAGGVDPRLSISAREVMLGGISPRGLLTGL